MATELFANNYSTTLAAPVGVGDATITTSAPAATALQAAGQFRIVIDNEIMLVTAGAATTTWTVSRGQESTAAATHLNNATVTHILTAGSLGNAPVSTGQLPASVVTATSPADTPAVTVGGSQLVNIPPWKTGTLYPSGYVIQNGGVAYMATATFTSGASFGADGANWAPLSSAELAYAQSTSLFSTTSTSYVDVTGLAIAVTTNGRPFMLELYASVQNTLAGAYSTIHILRTGDSVEVGYADPGLGSANEVWAQVIKARQSLAAGTYNYKIQVASSSGSNTAKVSGGATFPAYLQALQV